MFKYILYYDGGFLRDSADLGYTYETEEEAQTRDDYLANFDGSILSSGYHKVVGTCVFRVSDLLNASKQEEVFQNMYEKMIELR